MIEKVGYVRNPLTVIAIFAAIAEISGTTVLPFIAEQNQSTYIWFLMLFPTILIVCFFITLNFNHKVLYAPSDYKNEDNFLRMFSRASPEEKEEKLREEIEEVESQTDNEKEASSDASKGEEFGPKVVPRISSRDFMESLYLAESLAVKKLSAELGLDFKTDVSLQTMSNRKIVFDAIAVDGHSIHAMEVKLFKSEYGVSKIDRVLLEAELATSSLKGFDPKKFVLHFVAVVDNHEIDNEKLRNRLERYVSRFAMDVRIHVMQLEQLKSGVTEAA